MASRAKYVTFCTVCEQDGIGVHTNWERMQAARDHQYKVTRHGATPGPSVTGQRKTICGGTGIVVAPELVFVNEELMSA